MNFHWLKNTIVCDGTVICTPLDSTEYLSHQPQIAFRAKLLFNAWQARACDGRQMSLETFDQMDRFDDVFADNSHTEASLKNAISEFGQFIPAYLMNSNVNVPTRAVQWSRKDTA